MTISKGRRIACVFHIVFGTFQMSHFMGEAFVAD
jgi:hypothetical protein